MTQSTMLLQEQAYNIIKKHIQQGNFDKSQIYSLNTISKQLNMSKTPVRDAVQRLSREGFIEILPSRGIRIAQYSAKEIVEFFQTRYAISDFCCTMLALKHREDPSLPIFKKIEDELLAQERMKDAEFNDYYETDWNFHMLLVEGVSNHFFYETLENKKEIYRSFASHCIPLLEAVTDSIAEHRMIYEGICEGNVTKSRIASHNHLTRTLRFNLDSTDEIDEFIRKMIPIELIKVE